MVTRLDLTCVLQSTVLVGLGGSRDWLCLIQGSSHQRCSICSHAWHPQYQNIANLGNVSARRDASLPACKAIQRALALRELVDFVMVGQSKAVSSKDCSKREVASTWKEREIPQFGSHLSIVPNNFPCHLKIQLYQVSSIKHLKYKTPLNCTLPPKILLRCRIQLYQVPSTKYQAPLNCTLQFCPAT